MDDVDDVDHKDDRSVQLFMEETDSDEELVNDADPLPPPPASDTRHTTTGDAPLEEEVPSATSETRTLNEPETSNTKQGTEATTPQETPVQQQQEESAEGETVEEAEPEDGVMAPTLKSSNNQEAAEPGETETNVAVPDMTTTSQEGNKPTKDTLPPPDVETGIGAAAATTTTTPETSAVPKNRMIRNVGVALLMAAMIASAVTLPVVLITQLPAGTASSGTESNDTVGSGLDVATISPTVTPTTVPTTVSPTMSPTVSRQTAIENWVLNNGWSSELGPSQTRAIEWLATKDELALAVENSQDFRQRYAVTVLYYALLGSTGSWIVEWGLRPWQPICNWTNNLLTIDRELVPFGVSCGSNGTMTGLSLLYSNAVGTIPNEISLLFDLESLKLSDLELSGTINPKIATLSNLQVLDLSHNNLSGRLNFMTSLNQLQQLKLPGNRLEGQIPASRFLRDMLNLQVLNLADNSLTGVIEPLFNLPNIRNLTVANNQLSGTIPEYVSSKSLQTLDLARNQIRGTLPTNLFDTDLLSILCLHKNNLVGTVPVTNRNSTVTSVSRLSVLTLHNNELSGQIRFDPRLTNLRHVDFAANRFTGAIPTEYGLLRNLEYLSFSDNPFDPGIMPVSFLELTNIVDLSLQRTNLIGTLSSNWYRWSRLQMLDLSDNQLTGTLPTIIGFLSSMRFLQLNDNRLSGTVPSTFSSLSNLSIFMLERNSLSGSSDPLCQDTNSLFHAVTDCIDEVNCSCCTVCCVDFDEACNLPRWDGRFDPSYVGDYRRRFYQFRNDFDIIPT